MYEHEKKKSKKEYANATLYVAESTSYEDSGTVNQSPRDARIKAPLHTQQSLTSQVRIKECEQALEQLKPSPKAIESVYIKNDGRGAGFSESCLWNS